MSHSSNERTLPTLCDAVDGALAAHEFRCTVVFHPDIDRIGQSARLDISDGECVLGRYGPVFSGKTSRSDAPLQDPYVSRCAVLVQSVGDGLRLIRPESSSRCRVAGREVQGEVLLDEAALDTGVPLMLSHTIVLMLRRSVVSSHKVETADYGMLGSSPSMGQLRNQIQHAARSDLDVLIRGETGAGKELVAQAIHAASERASQPIVSVNIAAIPAPLAAAFLFGSTRGAFTGADKARAGYFQQAEGGTLFLDEIGDAPEEVQPLLLRALQQREVQVVGGATRKIDVRVISATDAELEGEDCSFKSALRYRLGALEIRVPALREHAEDIGELLLHALQRFSELEGREQWLQRSIYTEQHLAQWAMLFYEFACYHWPGNVRQLDNFAAQVVLASREAPVLPDAVREQIYATDRPAHSTATREDSPQPETQWRKLADVSEAEFEIAMEEARYEVTAVAVALGVSRQSLYRRIENSANFRSASDVPLPEIRAVLGASGQDVREAAMTLRVSESGLRQRLRAVRAHA